jgi:hypothetical protein
LIREDFHRGDAEGRSNQCFVTNAFFVRTVFDVDDVSLLSVSAPRRRASAVKAYWSATSDLLSASPASWCAFFGSGYVDIRLKGLSIAFVRAVRGGSW